MYLSLPRNSVDPGKGAPPLGGPLKDQNLEGEGLERGYGPGVTSTNLSVTSCRVTDLEVFVVKGHHHLPLKRIVLRTEMSSLSKEPILRCTSLPNRRV